MPITYKIYPEINIIFFICKGRMTAKEYFQAVQATVLEANYKYGMTKIVDMTAATEDIELDDIYGAIKYSKNLLETKKELEHTVLLSYSTSIHQLVNVTKLLAGKTPLKFTACYTLDETITKLGLSDSRQEILMAYRDVKTHSLLMPAR